MSARLVELHGLTILLLDAMDDQPVEHSEYILVTGAHCGLENARRVLRRPPRLAFFNDAGVGKDRAGVAGLDLLQSFHIPAAAVSAESARIGDAADTMEHGVVSFRNELAATLGVQVGERVREVLDRLEH